MEALFSLKNLIESFVKSFLSSLFFSAIMSDYCLSSLRMSVTFCTACNAPFPRSMTAPPNLVRLPNIVLFSKAEVFRLNSLRYSEVSSSSST
jgi:hypothetical protein